MQFKRGFCFLNCKVRTYQNRDSFDQILSCLLIFWHVACVFQSGLHANHIRFLQFPLFKRTDSSHALCRVDMMINVSVALKSGNPPCIQPWISDVMAAVSVCVCAQETHLAAKFRCQILLFFCSLISPPPVLFLSHSFCLLLHLKHIHFGEFFSRIWNTETEKLVTEKL